MPRVNRKRKKKTSGYTTWHVKQLEHGHDWGNGFGGDVEAICAAWKIFRAQILEDWIHGEPDYASEGPGPGSRPWAWWKFDAPELRRRVDGTHPFDDPVRIKAVEERAAKHPDFKATANKVYFGKPCCLCFPDDFEATYESEFDYLERLGLLLPGELEMVQALYGDSSDVD